MLNRLNSMTAFHVTHYRPDTFSTEFRNNFKIKYFRAPSALAAVGYDAASTLGTVFQKARSVRTPPLLDAVKKSRDITGLLSMLRVGWDKSLERAMSISSPQAGETNSGIIIIPEGFTIRKTEKTMISFHLASLA